MTFSIASRMMTVNVSISLWEGRRLDKVLTRKAIADSNVTDDNGLRVNKLLVSAESMKPYIAASNEIRTFVRERTVPWKDNGDRGLLRQGYMPFVEGFALLEAGWKHEVDQFIEHAYPSEVARASFRLADAFNPDDYPHAEDLRSRFKLTLDFDAIAESQDFRVSLDDDTVADIQGKISTSTEQRVNAVMADVWGRVETIVEHFAARTSPEAERFHATTISNISDLVNLLPSLNLTGDPKLAQIAERLQETLCQYDAKDIRTNKDVRANARSEAQSILEDMKGFSGVFF